MYILCVYMIINVNFKYIYLINLFCDFVLLCGVVCGICVCVE